MTTCDEIILSMARTKATNLGIDLKLATILVLEDPANVVLAEAYASGEAPSLRERQTAHLAAAMGRPVARGTGMPIEVALAQAAATMVRQGLAATHSAAVIKLLQDPATAMAYQQGRDVIGVAGAEIRLSPFSPTPAGPTVATFPQHRHVTTGMAA